MKSLISGVPRDLSKMCAFEAQLLLIIISNFPGKSDDSGTPFVLFPFIFS